MDDFARMMLQEGVRPLGSASQTRKAPSTDKDAGDQASPANTAKTSATTGSTGPTWKGGPEARRTLEAAIAMAQEDRREGSKTWITGLRQDGRAMPLRPEATLAEIITAADREDLRLITIAGKQWTCIMHPSMGIATIEHDAE